jgi:hypothetical protein
MSWLDELVLKYRADTTLADLFGVILYSDAQANVKKVLRDEDYWQSFDAVSGRHLAVFAIRTKAPAPLRNRDLDFIVPAWKEPRENLPLLKDLELSSTEKLPVIVWLTHDAGDLLRCVVPLKDHTEEAAYASIKEALTTASEAMEKVAKARSAKTGKRGGNLRNPLGVFAALSFAVDSKQDVKRLQKALKVWEFLKDLKP